MSYENVDFAADLQPMPVRDLLSVDLRDVPQQPGAYILMGASGFSFPYPGGASPVFYLGRTKNLRTRMSTHRRWIRRAKLARQLSVYRPRHEFGAAFGAHFSLVLASGFTPQQLEDLLMANFAQKFRSLPTANGAGSWKRIRKILASKLSQAS